MAKCSSCWVDGSSLGDQKRPRISRPLGVIVHTQLGMNVVAGRSNTGERGENDAMGKGYSTDLERGEKSRRVCGG